MPSEEERLLRAVFAAWNEHGVAGLEPFLTDDIEWHAVPEAPDATVHHGREETVSLLRGWEEGSGEMRVLFSVQEILGEGDEFVVVTSARVTGETSGVRLLEHPWFHVMRLRGGKLSRNRVFLNRDQALEALGQRE
jgi:ketosteroid isomerase-like protein